MKSEIMEKQSGSAHRREGTSQAFTQDTVVEQHQEVGGRVHWRRWRLYVRLSILYYSLYVTETM